MRPSHYKVKATSIAHASESLAGKIFRVTQGKPLISLEEILAALPEKQPYYVKRQLSALLKEGSIDDATDEANRIEREERKKQWEAEQAIHLARHKAVIERNARLVALEYEIISAGRRVLATKMHPDQGGSHDVMAELNEAAERLKELTHRWEERVDD